MTTLTVNETPAGDTPSQQAVSKAGATHVVTDALGRKITLRKPGVLAQYEIIDVMGADSAANMTYVNMVLPLTYVAAIDGEPVALPSHKSEIKALIKLLSEEGVDAVMAGVETHWGKKDPDPEGDRRALKK